MDEYIKKLRLVVVAAIALGLASPVAAQSERQVLRRADVRVNAAPTAPTAPWQPPDLGAYASTLAPAEPTEIVAGRAYSLGELIDIAERQNPATRVAWERAS